MSQSLKNPEIKKKVIQQIEENIDEVNENLENGLGNQLGKVEVYQNDDVKTFVNLLKVLSLIL